MLNEKRLLHMSRMEMRRIKESSEIAPFINVDKKDYLGYKRVTAFIAGSVFYGLFIIVFWMLLFVAITTEINKAIIILLSIFSVVGYLVFMYQYQNWTHKHTIERIKNARKKIKRLQKDWDTLEDMYNEEEKATSPGVDMDVLFPQGSLGEDE